MNLHRVGKEADWEKIPKEQWNSHQRWAAKTHGIVTRANGDTFIGMGFLQLGVNDVLKGRPIRGLLEMVIGKGFDWKDGNDAEKDGTKSRVGKYLDGAVDKIVVANTVPKLMRIGAMPKWAGRLILAQNISCAAATLVGMARGVDMNTEASNKWNNGLQAVETGTYTAAWTLREHYGNPAAARPIEIAGHAQSAVTTALGTVAAYNLWRQALGPVSAMEAAPEAINVEFPAYESGSEAAA